MNWAWVGWSPLWMCLSLGLAAHRERARAHTRLVAHAHTHTQGSHRAEPRAAAPRRLDGCMTHPCDSCGQSTKRSGSGSCSWFALSVVLPFPSLLHKDRCNIWDSINVGGSEPEHNHHFYATWTSKR